jgi:hypothetical protein
MRRFKESDDDIRMAAASFTLLASKISKEKRVAFLGEADIEQTKNMNLQVSPVLQFRVVKPIS